MPTREVHSPAAASQEKANGAWPSECRHGWKWSLMKTESNPFFSAETAKFRSSRAENCSAEALYPRRRGGVTNACCSASS